MAFTPSGVLAVGTAGVNARAMLSPADSRRRASLDAIFSAGLNGPELIPTACLIQEDTREIFRFASLQSEISDTVSAEYNSHDILGRSEPIRMYAKTSPRQIALMLEFYATENAYRDVKYKVDWLRSLMYPRYFRNVALNPPVVHLVIGDSIQMRSIVVGSMTVTHSAPFSMPELYSKYARVEFTLESVQRVPRGSMDIRNGF